MSALLHLQQLTPLQMIFYYTYTHKNLADITMLTKLSSCASGYHTGRLIVALFAPWVLLAIACTPLFVVGVLYRNGWDVRWTGVYCAAFFFIVSFLGLITGAFLIAMGIWWLIKYPSWRNSWCGWLWIILMCISVAGIGPAVGH